MVKYRPTWVVVRREVRRGVVTAAPDAVAQVAVVNGGQVLKAVQIVKVACGAGWTPGINKQSTGRPPSTLVVQVDCRGRFGSIRLKEGQT
jgi:hypothetical protein